MENMGPDGPKWGQEDFLPTNPDLADILDDTDFDFENLYFWDYFNPRFPDFWISRFLDSQIQGCHLLIFGRGGSKRDNNTTEDQQTFLGT